MGTKSIVPRVDNEGGIGENTTPKYWKEAYLYDVVLKDSPWVDVRAYASFSEAVDGIGATEKSMVVSVEKPVTGNKTVPETLCVHIFKGGYLNLADGIEVTFNCRPEAGRYQIFKLTGTAKIKFGPKANVDIYPEWWG